MYYTYQQFHKNDRKQFQELISLSTNRDAEKFLKENLVVLQKTMETKQDDFRVPYWEMAEKLKTFSKHLKRKYDGNSHTKFPEVIAIEMANGFILDSDLNHFSENTKTKLGEMCKWYKERTQ